MTNAVAMDIINGDLEPTESVRLYATLARTTVQSMTAEVQRARMAKTVPDLSLPDAETY